MTYKKHPQGLEFFNLPQPIVKQYEISCAYEYINIGRAMKIPVPWVALESLKHNNIDISTVPLVEYAKGFIKGYNELIPFIDTIETRKEVVLNEAIFKGYSSFEVIRTFGIGRKKISGTVTKESINKSGVTEGKRYKAWEVIFETPSFFLPIIEKLQSHPEEDSENNVRILVKKHLEFLSGKWKNFEIMTSCEYERLIDYAEYTYKNSKVPDEITPIQKGNSVIPELFLRHTIYLFWKKELKGKQTHRQALWINFYKEVFAPFVSGINGNWSKNFSKSIATYERDKQGITFQVL